MFSASIEKEVTNVNIGTQLYNSLDAEVGERFALVDPNGEGRIESNRHQSLAVRWTQRFSGNRVLDPKRIQEKIAEANTSTLGSVFRLSSHVRDLKEEQPAHLIGYIVSLDRAINDAMIGLEKQALTLSMEGNYKSAEGYVDLLKEMENLKNTGCQPLCQALSQRQFGFVDSPDDEVQEAREFLNNLELSSNSESEESLAPAAYAALATSNNRDEEEGAYQADVSSLADKTCQTLLDETRNAGLDSDEALLSQASLDIVRSMALKLGFFDSEKGKCEFYDVAVKPGAKTVEEFFDPSIKAFTRGDSELMSRILTVISQGSMAEVFVEFSKAYDTKVAVTTAGDEVVLMPTDGAPGFPKDTVELFQDLQGDRIARRTRYFGLLDANSDTRVAHVKSVLTVNLSDTSRQVKFSLEPIGLQSVS